MKKWTKYQTMSKQEHLPKRLFYLLKRNPFKNHKKMLFILH